MKFLPTFALSALSFLIASCSISFEENALVFAPTAVSCSIERISSSRVFPNDPISFSISFSESIDTLSVGEQSYDAAQSPLIHTLTPSAVGSYTLSALATKSESEQETVCSIDYEVVRRPIPPSCDSFSTNKEEYLVGEPIIFSVQTSGDVNSIVIDGQASPYSNQGFPFTRTITASTVGSFDVQAEVFDTVENISDPCGTVSYEVVPASVLPACSFVTVNGSDGTAGPVEILKGQTMDVRVYHTGEVNQIRISAFGQDSITTETGDDLIPSPFLKSFNTPNAVQTTVSASVKSTSRNVSDSCGVSIPVHIVNPPQPPSCDSLAFVSSNGNVNLGAPLQVALRHSGTVDTVSITATEGARVFPNPSNPQVYSVDTGTLGTFQVSGLAIGLGTQDSCDEILSYTVTAPDFNELVSFDDRVEAIAKGPGETVYVAGRFEQANGNVARRIVRLLPDGRIDAAFATGTGFNGRVRTLAYSPGSRKLYVGGHFTSYNSRTSHRFAVLNENGTRDTDFNNGHELFDSDKNTVSSSYFVKTITLDGSRIYIGGKFYKYKDHSVKHLVALDTSGQLVSEFQPEGIEDTIHKLIVNDSKVYAAGTFDIGAIQEGGLVCFEPNGSRCDFLVDNFKGKDIRTLAVAKDRQSIYAGGDFTLSLGMEGNLSGIAKIDLKGNIDTNFQAAVYRNAGVQAGQVLHIALSADNTGDIYVGGDFSRVRPSGNPATLPAENLVRLTNGGQIRDGFSSSDTTDDTVLAILPLSEGEILVGGEFDESGHLVKLLSDGQLP